jgi:hypothetical protein
MFDRFNFASLVRCNGRKGKTLKLLEASDRYVGLLALVLINHKHFEGSTLCSYVKDPFKGETHDEDKKDRHEKEESQGLPVAAKDFHFFYSNGNYLMNKTHAVNPSVLCR